VRWRHRRTSPHHNAHLSPPQRTALQSAPPPTCTHATERLEVIPATCVLLQVRFRGCCCMPCVGGQPTGPCKNAKWATPWRAVTLKSSNNEDAEMVDDLRDDFQHERALNTMRTQRAWPSYKLTSCVAPMFSWRDAGAGRSSRMVKPSACCLPLSGESANCV
jgi:hypothetical protein